MYNLNMSKKKVIAYLHTHWDREWYREFEVFRLRLLRVFDNVLKLLEEKKIPSFYFDGQVCALEDYLALRPENETLVRRFIEEKRLFIGPCYTLVDEFMTDRKCFEKNLEIGIRTAKSYGCEDFIGYLADTFGHSKHIPEILKQFGVDKCVVWRGCGDLPSEFIFNGINTVQLVRGYFFDIFSSNLDFEKQVEFLKSNLDKISEKSGDTLLLPIGADHLGVEADISDKIARVNECLEGYELKLSSPFEYFELVKDNFKFNWDDELRDNSKTFILPGSYSARTRIKQANTHCTYMLNLADCAQNRLKKKYESAIDYGYKLLLKNQAHDGICGCSTDLVHRENMLRYEKISELAMTVLKELKFLNPQEFERFWVEHNKKYRSVMEFEGVKVPSGGQKISTREGFVDEILYDTQKIPVTEDYTEIHTYLQEISQSEDVLNVEQNRIWNSKISLVVRDEKIWINDKFKLDFVMYDDLGDTYNFGPDSEDRGQVAKIFGSEIFMEGDLRVGLRIWTTFFDVAVTLDKNSEILKFRIDWENKHKNKLLQARISLLNPIYETVSEDMGKIIIREFNPDYDIREHLPKEKGQEVKTNTAPMQRFVGAQGVGIISKGLHEYEVFKNTLSLTLLRSVGIISNPKNPARSTPAGPPIPVFEAQQSGKNTAEFAIGMIEPQNYSKHVEEFFLHGILV